jgi:hypothetical protein
MKHKLVGISLGKDCLPAGWGVDKKIRERKIDGYKTCPFDMMISDYTNMVKCISEDFLNFTNPEYLKYNDGGLITNTYYNFKFNHETPHHADLYKKEKWEEGPNHFINNNFANFIQRYNERINNFKQYLNNKNNFITFILHSSDNNCENNCEQLKKVLLTKYPDLFYKIIIIKGPIPHKINETNIVKIINDPKELKMNIQKNIQKSISDKNKDKNKNTNKNTNKDKNKNKNKNKNNNKNNKTTKKK